MLNDTTTSDLHPKLTSLETILTHDSSASHHDNAHAYIALTDYLRFIKHTQDTYALLPYLRTRVPQLVKSIERDTFYAVDTVGWMAREEYYEAEGSELEEREHTSNGALRCLHALQLFDVLCMFYDEILAGYNQEVIHLFKVVFAIVGSPVPYFEQESIRAQAAHVLRMRLGRLPAIVLEDLYGLYISLMLSVLQKEEYVQTDNSVLHYCVLSIANITFGHPSTALERLACLLPKLYPLLTTKHTTLRLRVTQAVVNLAHAYAFNSTPTASSSDFQHALASSLRDWAKAEAKLRQNTSRDTFWQRLRESKRGSDTWAWTVCSALLVILGRRVWWIPETMRMLTSPMRDDQPRASPGDSVASSGNSSTLSTAPVLEQMDEDGPTRAELTADMYRLLAHALARMRLWQQDHGYPVRPVPKENEKVAQTADKALAAILTNWPSLSRASTPEPHQRTCSTQPSADEEYTAATTFVPAILWALGPDADEEDKAWNVVAAISILKRMVLDGAKEGEEMLMRLVGAKKEDTDVEMDSGEDAEEKEIRRREAVIARLLSRRALGQQGAPSEAPVNAQDVKALEPCDIMSNWTDLVECWVSFMQHNPYSDNVALIFNALLRSNTSGQMRLQLVGDLSKYAFLPMHGDVATCDLLTRLWDVALVRLGATSLEQVARLHQQLLFNNPPERDDVFWRIAWLCLACTLPIKYTDEEWSKIDLEVPAVLQTTADIFLTSQYHRLAVALARATPLDSISAANSLYFVSRALELAYATALSPTAPSFEPVDHTSAFSILSELRKNIASHGISVRSAITLVLGLTVWIGDERRVVSDNAYNAEIVKLLEVLLDAIEPPGEQNQGSLTLDDLTSLSPIFTAAMDRLSSPGHAADSLWAFWTRVHGRLALKGEEYPWQIQGAVPALCIFLGHDVPEGMETQTETGASQIVDQGTPSIQASQPPPKPEPESGGLQTQGQTSSAMYWAAQSSLPSHLLKTQPRPSAGVPQSVLTGLPQPASIPPVVLPVLPSRSQLAGLTDRVQASLARRDEPELPPAKRRRLTPDHAEEAQHHPGPLSSTSRPLPRPQQSALHSNSYSNHPNTASSTRSRKSHLPTPAPSEAPLSSPVEGPVELAPEEEEVVPDSQVDEEWDGDEGMIIDEGDEEEEGEGGDGDGWMKDATESIQCARGHEEDVPGVDHGASRSSIFGRYTYSRREKEKDEDEIVPATPGADDEPYSSSSPGEFFSHKRQRPAPPTSPLLTFNLSYSQAGTPSPVKPAQASYSPAYSPESPSMDAPYSERGSIEVLRNLPRGQRNTMAGPSASVAPMLWSEESGEIPGFGGDDVHALGDLRLKSTETKRDASERFSYSEQGSLEILRNLPKGPMPAYAGVNTLGGHVEPVQEEEEGGIPGLGGFTPTLAGRATGIGTHGGQSGGETSGIPSFESLVDAINIIEAYNAQGLKDERALAELARLRGILSQTQG